MQKEIYGYYFLMNMGSCCTAQGFTIPSWPHAQPDLSIRLCVALLCQPYAQLLQSAYKLATLLHLLVDISCCPWLCTRDPKSVIAQGKVRSHNVFILHAPPCTQGCAALRLLEFSPCCPAPPNAATASPLPLPVARGGTAALASGMSSSAAAAAFPTLQAGRRGEGCCAMELDCTHAFRLNTTKTFSHRQHYLGARLGLLTGYRLI